MQGKCGQTDIPETVLSSLFYAGKAVAIFCFYQLLIILSLRKLFPFSNR